MYLDILSREDLMQEWMDNNKGYLRRTFSQRVAKEIVQAHQDRNIKEDLPSYDDLVTVSCLLDLKEIINIEFQACL